MITCFWKLAWVSALVYGDCVWDLLLSMQWTNWETLPLGDLEVAVIFLNSTVKWYWVLETEHGIWPNVMIFWQPPIAKQKFSLVGNSHFSKPVSVLKQNKEMKFQNSTQNRNSKLSEFRTFDNVKTQHATYYVVEAKWNEVKINVSVLSQWFVLTLFCQNFVRIHHDSMQCFYLNETSFSDGKNVFSPVPFPPF